MENNFFVGVVHHGKKLFKPEYSEKVVLYSEDNVNFLDLRCCIWYTTNCNDKDYVEKETIISTDISLYREDYLYLLSKFKETGLVRKKRFDN